MPFDLPSGMNDTGNPTVNIVSLRRTYGFDARAATSTEVLRRVVSLMAGMAGLVLTIFILTGAIRRADHCGLFLVFVQKSDCPSTLISRIINLIKLT